MWNARILAVGAALLLAACGSGSDAPTASVLFSADAANSGYVVDGATTFPGNVVAVGDSSLNSVARGFYRFDITGLPAGVNVIAATLRTGQNSVTGDPYGEFGGLVVDHVDLGAGLNNTDFGAAPLAAVIGTLSTNATQEAKSVDVTGAVQADVAAARTTSDYRLYFVGAPDGEADDDFVHLTNTGVPGAVNVEPVLIIDYNVP